MRHISFLIVVSLFLSVLLSAGCTDISNSDRYNDYNLTLSYDGNEKNLTLSDLENLPSFAGNGYLISTVGIRYGPLMGRGVPLTEVVKIMNGINESSRLYFYGSDGYLWVLDYDQIHGKEFITFDENLTELKDQNITPVLMYEQDGKQITEEDGGPVRLALLTEKNGIITEGSGWVKWISRIELH